jgi:hypothetical protein
MQTLVATELFNRAGRWYLMDDGGVCYTYLESPQVRQSAGRLVLSAHLSSRLGQRVGDNCLGARFSSNVTLSGHLRGAEHQLVLDDLRIDHVDDESTRNALDLALQLDPRMLPRSTTIDISDYLQSEVKSAAGVAVRMEQFRILNIGTQTDAIVVQFEASLTTP